MTKSILVAIDLSHQDASTAILKRASEIAGLDGADLSVATVVPDYGASFVSLFFDEQTMPKALSAAQDALHAFVDQALPDHGPVRHIVANGTVYDEIMKAAEKIGADMIVIGAAKPDVSAYLLGPNAARVARHFSGSVLIVR